MNSSDLSVSSFIDRLEDWSEAVRSRLGFRRQDDKLTIVPYMGYGNESVLKLRARVLHGFQEPEVLKSDTTLQNLGNAYRYFDTDEVPGAPVRATFEGLSVEGVTDDEGYVALELEVSGLPAAPGPGWHSVDLETGFDLQHPNANTTVKCPVLVPNSQAGFGVISDIDDTILQTGVNNKLQMLITTISSNAHTRLPFTGVAAFYRALGAGPLGDADNPFFYVSRSPYNLHHLLVSFMEINGLPKGPIFLRDFGLATPFGLDRQTGHKIEHISGVLDTYPDLSFVLIGDDGEADPEIYAEIVRRYPSRIKAIYIRHSAEQKRKIAEMAELARAVSASGAQLIFARDSAVAAAHAAGQGLISASALAAVETEKWLDEGSDYSQAGSPMTGRPGNIRTDDQ